MECGNYIASNATCIARMLDKVDRSPMTIGHTYEEDWYVRPNDHL